MPRYVVLRHEMPAGAARSSHWDFMLERGDVLRTWALPQPPDVAASQVVELLPDHRLAYLEYEGAVSGGRGKVSRWDAGSYEPRDEDEGADACLSIRLTGSRLCGEVKLIRLEDGWRFQYFANADA